MFTACGEGNARLLMASQIMSHLSRGNNKFLVKQRDGDDKTYSDS